jgi:sigma-B regulation protein RsbU (phosphoserine phosphatase)
VLVRASGAVERLTAGGPVLGVLQAGSYEQDSVALGSGDRVVMYTDGITEARNAADEEFGEDRLVASIVEHRACCAPALQARLADTVASFTGGQFQDDATLIVIAMD